MKTQAPHLLEANRRAGLCHDSGPGTGLRRKRVESRRVQPKVCTQIRHRHRTRLTYGLSRRLVYLSIQALFRLFSRGKAAMKVVSKFMHLAQRPFCNHSRRESTAKTTTQRVAGRHEKEHHTTWLCESLIRLGGAVTYSEMVQTTPNKCSKSGRGPEHSSLF
jgi:hypothetical protein